MDKVEKIIFIVRSLNEDGAVVSGAPTNSLNSPSDGKGYIAGTKEAGDNPPVFNKGRYRNNYAKGGRGSRKWWLQFLKGR